MSKPKFIGVIIVAFIAGRMATSMWDLVVLIVSYLFFEWIFGLFITKKPYYEG